MIAFDEAVAEIENHKDLASLREVRANVLSEATKVVAQLAANDGWRNPDAAEAEAKRILKTVADYNAAVSKAGLTLALRGDSHPVARKAFDNLKVSYPALDSSTLYRTIGRAADQRAQDRREKERLAACYTRLKHLTARLQGSGKVFKLYNDPRKPDLAQRQIGSPAIDLEAMSARFTINTAAVDREREVILPRGVTFDRYRLNPTVLWEHGFDPNISVPIGRCEHPDGRLAIEVSDEAIVATCYFARGVPEAEKIWSLVRQGVVRAASIHVIPKTQQHQWIDGEMATVYTQSEMLEWSIGRLGVNPEAVVS